jgi:hypothetical protein
MRSQSLKLLGVLAAGTLLVASAQSPMDRSVPTVARGVPKVQPEHPGNVFVQGESVTVPVPEEYRAQAKVWRVVDVDGQEMGSGEIAGGCSLGSLPVGWYRVDLFSKEGQKLGWTTGAVLATPTVPTPQDSPVCVDAATSWFARDSRERREGFAYLASLAGVNWIRDRMSWGELEPKAGQYAKDTIYDAAAEAEHRYGLKVLQVFHSTPKWATRRGLDNGGSPWKRFPRDLCDIFVFTQDMARRYNGQVLAWEPWNEANINGFGGHTIDEMCTLQKAAYFGLKSGAPRITVCWNVFAGAGNDLQTEGVLRNETWPYFETYNIHSYSPTTSYEKQFEGARDAASGRPIWISECGIRLKAETPKPWGEMTRGNEIKQGEFIPRSFATSLYSGVNRHFFFILGNYWERGIQFGLLRHDLTPRPGYLALAATGRFLAAAECLGKISGEGYELVAFSARPDGRKQTVLVGWADEPCALPRTIRPVAAYDCFGRKLGRAILSERPVFLVLPEEAAENLSLTLPPTKAHPRGGKPCPVVLQAQFRESTRWLQAQAHRLPAGRIVTVPLHVYNFSRAAAHGTLRVAEKPADWRVTIADEDITLPPGEKLQTTMRLRLPPSGTAALAGDWVTIRGDLGHLGEAVLSFRLAADLKTLKPTAEIPLTCARKPETWTRNINKGATMTSEVRKDGAALFTMEFGDSDPWAYPFLTLPETEAPPADYDGVAMTVQLLEGTGDIRCQFAEDGGATYLGELDANPDTQAPQTVFALFKNASWGSYSAKDENGKLDPPQIRRLLVGINAKPKTKVRLLVKDLRWVKF